MWVSNKVRNRSSSQEIDGNQAKVRYDISHGERVYLYLIKQRLVVGGGMFVKNVVRKERQHEYSTHITSRVGTNSPKIDTIGIMEWYCVGSVTTRFIESINMRHWRNRSYYGNI